MIFEPKLDVWEPESLRTTTQMPACAGHHSANRSNIPAPVQHSGPRTNRPQ